jgi:ornithine cyclodeaminase/alanine dehydrogenase-like protein (mu-crystallin family)
MIHPRIANFNHIQLRYLLDSFKLEYEPAFSDDKARVRLNPFKLVRVKDYVDGVPTTTISLLYGHLPISGWYGTKTILSKETETGVRRKSFTILFDKENEYKAIYESSILTKLRCAVMAAYILQETKRKHTESVLLIGAGGVNLAIMDVLNRLLDFQNFTVVSRSQRKLSRIRPNHGIDLDRHLCRNFRHDREYDIISTATTNNEQFNRLRPYQYKGAKLVLAWDTGYMMPMDEKFQLFSDYPEQLLKVKDIEFPFDEDLHDKNISCMTYLKEHNLPAIVYFYGVGMADILVAQHYFLGGHR